MKSILFFASLVITCLMLSGCFTIKDDLNGIVSVYKESKNMDIIDCQLEVSRHGNSWGVVHFWKNDVRSTHAITYGITLENRDSNYISYVRVVFNIDGEITDFVPSTTKFDTPEKSEDLSGNSVHHRNDFFPTAEARLGNEYSQAVLNIAKSIVGSREATVMYFDAKDQVTKHVVTSADKKLIGDWLKAVNN